MVARPMAGNARTRGSSGGAAGPAAALIAGAVAAGLAASMLVLLTGAAGPSTNQGCGPPQSINLGPSGTEQIVGATEYGGPGDPSSGVVGASGSNLLSHPDSYAELGGESFQTATAIGGVGYTKPRQKQLPARSGIA